MSTGLLPQSAQVDSGTIAGISSAVVGLVTVLVGLYVRSVGNRVDRIRADADGVRADIEANIEARKTNQEIVDQIRVERDYDKRRIVAQDTEIVALRDAQQTQTIRHQEQLDVAFAEIRKLRDEISAAHERNFQANRTIAHLKMILMKHGIPEAQEA
jgi:outer membrane murein-binding lipoprotein Lpp